RTLLSMTSNFDHERFADNTVLPIFTMPRGISGVAVAHSSADSRRLCGKVVGQPRRSPFAERRRGLDHRAFPLSGSPHLGLVAAWQCECRMSHRISRVTGCSRSLRAKDFGVPLT